jgi:hypothetical protein
MMLLVRILVLVSVAGLMMVGPASGASIAYTESVIGSGQFGSSVFSNALVTFTAVGDTAHITNFLGGFNLPANANSATVNVQGFGMATIFDPIVLFLYQRVMVELDLPVERPANS